MMRQPERLQARMPNGIFDSWDCRYMDKVWRMVAPSPLPKKMRRRFFMVLFFKYSVSWAESECD